MDEPRAGQGNWERLARLLDILSLEQVEQIIEAYKLVDANGGHGEIRIVIERHHPRWIKAVMGWELVKPE